MPNPEHIVTEDKVEVVQTDAPPSPSITGENSEAARMNNIRISNTSNSSISSGDVPFTPGGTVGKCYRIIFSFFFEINIKKII